MAASSSNKMRLSSNELCDSTMNYSEPISAFSEVHRQESGIFEGSSDFSDYCFSDNDIEWHSCDEGEGSAAEDSNARLWEEFQQCTFWSPVCTIKQAKCSLPITNTVEEDIPMMKLSSSRKKRVTFKPDRELVTTHRIIAWDYAYRACRRGPWEQMAQDRARFARRIDEVALVLEPCLKKLVNKITRTH